MSVIADIVRLRPFFGWLSFGKARSVNLRFSGISVRQARLIAELGMLPSFMFIAAAAASASAPTCNAGGRPIATSLRELPASVRAALAHRVADRDQPFNISDAIAAGQERRPFMRLICGYPISGGYVVEREQGGRGYNVGKIVFDTTNAGYRERR
jgi:hypothetical protein